MPETANSTDFQSSLTNECVQTPLQAASQTRRRWVEWAKLIALTGSAQVMVQAIGFISGILVIRLLPTHEYALYTLANTMLGTMTLLADGGISTGVMSQGGKVWQDKQKLGAVLVTGMQLRKKFAVFSLLVATPILFYLLRKHDASWLMSTLIVLSLIPTFFTSLSGTLLEIVLKLHQDIKPLQKIQVVTNVGRLALLGLTLFVYPFAAVAIICAGVTQIWSNWKLRKHSKRYSDHSQSDDPEIRSEILLIVKRLMPGAIYYCISGQVTIWLISMFGTTEGIAQVGALSRLAMLLNLFSTLFSALIVPRFARLPDHRRLLTNRYLQIQTSLIAISIGIVTTIWFFQSQLLWILGKNYLALTNELVLIGIGSCISLIGGTLGALNQSRGMISVWYLYPGISLLTTAFFISVANLDEVSGVLTLNLMLSTIYWLLDNIVFLYFNIIKNKRGRE